MTPRRPETQALQGHLDPTVYYKPEALLASTAHPCCCNAKLDSWPGSVSDGSDTINFPSYLGILSGADIGKAPSRLLVLNLRAKPISIISIRLAMGVLSLEWRRNCRRVIPLELAGACQAIGSYILIAELQATSLKTST